VRRRKFTTLLGGAEIAARMRATNAATAYEAYAVTRIEGSNVRSDTVENSTRNNGRKKSCH
jgi:hypothetical protein